MQKTITRFSIFLYPVLCTVIGITACKKNTAATHSRSESTISFTFKGVDYVLPYTTGTPDWSVDITGFTFLRSGIFGGTVRYYEANCAYFEPGTAGLVHRSLAPGCMLTTNGATLDSVAIYLYQSGSYKISYENCYTKTIYDIVTRTSVTYDICDASGSFDLELKNKNGNTMSITNGSFKMYDSGH